MKQASPGHRPRGRPRGFDRVAALDRAMRLFWERGYEATSVADLADAMAINPPSLYAAFGDKKRLFAESVERYRAGPGSFAVEAIAGAPSARVAVAQLLDSAAAHYSDPNHPRGCMVIHAGQNCAVGDEEVARDLAAIRGSMEALIRTRIELGVQQGELPPGTDPADLAAFYAAVIQGMSTKARDGAPAEQLNAVARRAMTAWPQSIEDG